jgi:filamentous hemagglutinin
MDNTRIAAAREAGIDVQARVRGYSDPLTPEIQQARGWKNYNSWGEAITGRINKQSGGFGTNSPQGSTQPPRISGGGNSEAVSLQWPASA